MSTEKEQNQTKENQFPLQEYVWWPWSTKLRVIAIAMVTLAFFLGTTIKVKAHPMGDKKEGDNIQWLVDWMKSPESQNKLMIRCEKVNDHELKCTKEPEEGNSHAENSKQSQPFFLRPDDLKGHQNHSENFLCCHPCTHSPSKNSTKTTEGDGNTGQNTGGQTGQNTGGQTSQNTNTTGGGNIVENDCKHLSVTLSNKFEYELKRMLEYELQLLQKNTEFQTLGSKCKTNLFMTNFDNILSKTLKEVSRKKSTNSTKQVIVTSQVKQREEEVRRDENLATTAVCCKDIINLRRQVADLTRQLEELREKVVQSFQSASTAKSQ